MKKLLSLIFTLMLAYSTQAQFQINEILYDPADSTAGDANGDGIRDPLNDEFIEFVNAGATALDVSGYRIYEVKIATGVRTLRHTMDSGTVVPSLGALVVFGGGNAVGAFGGAIVKVDRGTQGLSLNNTGEAVIITDSTGRIRLDSINFDALSDNPDESYTRNPDVTGPFVQHHLAQAGKLFSPGTYANGTPFNVVATQPRLSIPSLQLYPNPSAGIVQIPQLAPGAILIVRDMTGKPVSPVRTGQSLDFSNLPSGLYCIFLNRKSETSAAHVLISK